MKHASTYARGIALLSLGCLATACATLPDRAPEDALYVDVRKAVELRESAEWVIDRLEIEAVAPAAMRSACQVDVGARQRLITWLDAQIALHGGPAAAAFARDTNADIDAALTLERVKAVIVYAQDHANECPFWLKPSAQFTGVQSDARRAVVLAESVGGGGLIVSGGRASLGGGGGGRLSFGFGFDQQLTLALGVEAGGVGSFASADDRGGRTLVGRFSAAIPLVLRVTNGARLLDLEAGPTTRWSTTSVRLPPGARFAIGYGISTMRVGAFLPTASLRLSFEVLPASDSLPAEYLLLIGTKVGIDIDP